MRVDRSRLTKFIPPILAIFATSVLSSPAASQDSTLLKATPIVTGLTFPVAFVQDPTQPNVQLVVQQGGRIRVVRDGQLLATDFLDLSGAISSGGERGLLGLAFAPDYATSRRIFVNFTNPAGHTVIARFVRSTTDPLRADPASRFDLRWPDGKRFITQPFSNHNGGDLHFGSDGYLYIGMGDGGSGNDPLNAAQDPMSLLGKFLRIDVAVPDSDPEGYDVPFDNPFVGNAAFHPEIWSLGFRNPFRFSVDARERGGSGALLIGDVGQSGWEEVDFDPFGRGGRNYGWRNREGAHDNVTTAAPATLPLIDPIVEYSRAFGNVITGGLVYRGSGLGLGFFGRYFFADFGSGRVWSVRLVLDPSTGDATATEMTEHLLGTALGNVSAFGIDAACEVYLVDYAGGRLLRIDPTGTPAGSGCATPDPFLVLGGGAWTNGGWLPPTHPLAANAGRIAVPSAPSSGGAACASPRPGQDWVCVNGGWLPPGHPLIGGTAAPSGGGSTGTPSTSTCSSPLPAQDWVCVNGGWVPPGHPLAAGTPAAPTGTGGSSGTPSSSACTTPLPGGDWVCVNGGWLPPGHPLITGSGASAVAPTPTSCIGPDPFIGIRGLVGVCINGGWVPRETGGMP